MDEGNESAKKPWPRWLYWWLAVWTAVILAAVGYFGYFIYAHGDGAAMGRETMRLTQAASHDGELLPSRPVPSATLIVIQPSPTGDTAAPTATAPESPTAAAGPTETPTTAPKQRATLPMQSPEYGMQAFLWWRPETAHRDLGMIRDAGFTWVKQTFAWRDIELSKGEFDWSMTDRIMEQVEQFGLHIVVRLDHQPQWAGGGYPLNGPPDDLNDFADFCSALASRYQGRIDAYEIWNEPNLAREWGGRSPNAAEYVNLLKVGYTAIKQADPDAIVITAGLTPTGTQPPDAMPDDTYLRDMYVAGARGYYDMIGMHAAGYRAAPEVSPDEAAADKANYGGERFFCFRRVEDLRAIMVEFGDSQTQVAILEFGWTSDTRPDSPYYWHAVDEFQKADYLVRAYQYAKANWSPWVGLMSLIYIGNPDWTPADEQWYWSITNPDIGSPRTAYIKLQEMAK
ncbi:MAG: cellulase family glycosylhydrolase [Anaerolineae bacterium]